MSKSITSENWYNNLNVRGVRPDGTGFFNLPNSTIHELLDEYLADWRTRDIQEFRWIPWIKLQCQTCKFHSQGHEVFQVESSGVYHMRNNQEEQVYLNSSNLGVEPELSFGYALLNLHAVEDQHKETHELKLENFKGDHAKENFKIAQDMRKHFLGLIDNPSQVANGYKSLIVRSDKLTEKKKVGKASLLINDGAVPNFSAFGKRTNWDDEQRELKFDIGYGSFDAHAYNWLQVRKAVNGLLNGWS